MVAWAGGVMISSLSEKQETGAGEEGNLERYFPCKPAYGSEVGLEGVVGV